MTLGDDKRRQTRYNGGSEQHVTYAAAFGKYIRTFFHVLTAIKNDRAPDKWLSSRYISYSVPSKALLSTSLDSGLSSRPSSRSKRQCQTKDDKILYITLQPRTLRLLPTIS
jgi:hypothetical protein